MGWNDNLGRLDSITTRTVCRCGAVYSIYEDDGIAGCREIEKANCRFCGQELARHFGNCTGSLLDSSSVPIELKEARHEYDRQIEEYIKKFGYNWRNKKYQKIVDTWHQAINKQFQ